LFLEASALGYREKYPGLYAKVDAIKADPTRHLVEGERAYQGRGERAVFKRRARH
jgi:hypothetical protein